MPVCLGDDENKHALYLTPERSRCKANLRGLKRRCFFVKIGMPDPYVCGIKLSIKVR
jgi:hypothetical protein